MSVELKKKLNPDDATFVELKKGNYRWWENLKKDEDNISIQIRKDNYIDVYRNGGAILKGLKYTGKAFTAEIHSEYIPIKRDKKGYVGLTLNADGISFKGTIESITFKQFDDAELKAVKHRIEARFNSETEKAIQYKFATSDPFIIDTEFQMGRENLRIDLIRLDASVNKIVFIEVKTMGDTRLFAPPDKENIHDQLEKYMNFAVKHKNDIRDYYSKVLQIKNDLGIAKPELKKLKLSEWEVKEKTLLLFGDCEKVWIDKNADGAGGINEKIKDVACGAFYFGNTKYNLDLTSKSKYRYIF
jgi:hypothetical protein